VPNKDFARDYSDLSPELIEVVRALQASLAEKRVRQQLQSVDSEQPSKLESAFSAQQAKRASRPELFSHPQLLAAVVESADAGIISETWNGVLLTWNKGAERIFGYSAAEIIGQSGRVLLPPDKAAEEQDFLARLGRAEHVVRHETVRLKNDGTPVEVAMTVSPLRDASGHIAGTSTIARDITERKRIEAHTRALAVTDELTGLHNRRGFTAIAEQQLKLARRSRAPLHIGFIDMDGMKAINDQFGHAVGDEALKDTAALLRASFRDSDVLARVGGDEFLVLAVDADDKTMERIQERLFASLAKANQEAHRPYALSLSLGVVACDVESGTTLDQMIEEADRRMYEAKGQKRPRPSPPALPQAGWGDGESSRTASG